MQDESSNDQHPPAGQVTRRTVLGLVVVAGAGLVACSTPAASPTAAPTKPAAQPAKPAAQPTTATKPTAAAATAKPAAPTAAAKTQAPAVKPKPALKPESLTFATANTIAGSIPWRIGLARGFFKDFSVDLTPNVVRGSNNVIAAVLSGGSQFGEGGMPAPLAAIEKGQSFKFLAGSYSKAPYVFFSRPEIKSMSDLIGKTVGSDQPGSLTYSINQALLKNANIDTSKIQQAVIGSSPDIYKAIVAGKVDAGLGNITFMPSAEKDGVTPLVKVWEALPNYSAAGIYAPAETIKDRRQALVQTLAGFAKSFQFSRQPEAKEIWHKIGVEEFGESAEQADFEYQWMRDVGGMTYDLVITKEQVEYMQQLNIDAGTQTKMLPYEQVVDFSLAKEALELLKG